MSIPHQSLYEEIQLVLQSKCEEFQLYEYQQVTPEQLWRFCVEKKWRKHRVEDLRPYEIVATIFMITASELMRYAQVKEYHYQDERIEINMEEFNLLMGQNKE